MKRRTMIVVASFVVLLTSAACHDDASAPASAQPDASDACPDGYAECDGNPSTVCEAHLATDPASCGACGKSCPAGANAVPACRASVCGLSCTTGFTDCDHDEANGCETPTVDCGVTTIVATLSAPIGLAVDEASVYYGTRGTAPDYLDGVVFAVPKDGGEPRVIANALHLPLNLTIDSARICWTDGGRTDRAEGSVECAAKSGADRKVVASGLQRPGNPTIVDDRVYFTIREQPTGRIAWARIDGSDPAPTTIVTGISNASDLERAGTTLVWSAENAVERVAFDGSSRVVLATGITSPAYQIGVAPDAVFVGTQTEASVRRVPFDLSGVTTIGWDFGNVQEVLFDGTTVYATTGGHRQIVAMAPDGAGAPRTIADGQIFPSYLAQDESYVYWTDGQLTSGPAAIRKAKKR